jgi:23S rRNA pseudouridine1911/1915/1917 synthase
VSGSIGSMRFCAGPRDENKRLDRLVVAWLDEIGRPSSRATVQRWIAEGRVRVDGATARASATVAVGAVVLVEPSAPPPTAASPDPSVELDVVYEDEHLVIIDKPAGLVVHPAPGHRDKTLVNGLLARGGFERGQGDDGLFRPGIVHRIDKGTSGLLVVAKNDSTREALKAQFAAHTIEREYVAVVVGGARDATYESLHGRHPVDRLRFTTHVRRGRRAVTHVRVAARWALASLVACRLETGRTHQIRVHLSELAKTPILGDPLYAKPPKDPTLRRLAEGLGRQALHAAVLGFVHPATGESVRWEAPLPPDLTSVIDELARDAGTSPRRR